MPTSHDADRDTTVPTPVIGMAHLPALPGAPGADRSREDIRERLRADADALVAGGVDGILLENFGDAPFYPETVPAHVVADLTALATDLTDRVDVPVGVNVLRNDATAALAVAAAAGSFIRVNVHVGTATTDQGVLEGRAHETLRLRERIDAAEVGILADVHVKHATSLSELPIEQVARETVDRGRADGLIVSGPGTGVETPLDDLRQVVAAATECSRSVPVFVGSGVTPDTVGDVLGAGADGVIVGTALKRNGETAAPVSRSRVEDLIEAVDAAGD